MKCGWIYHLRNAAPKAPGITVFRNSARTRLYAGCFALALTAQIGFAAGTSCPVSLQHVKRNTGIGDRNTYCFSLVANNQSGRRVAVVHINAVAIDSKPWEHPLRYDYVVSDLEPGQTKAAYFSTHRLLGTDYRGVKVWVESVEFEDKSTWKDAGGRVCGAKDVARR
ncbi:MAG TPA: hypothetical protein VN633_00005 [Bryobacteraceae bacterium]|nr:hypothetical protein [Bryobacteraceae bacterium]